MTRTEIDWNRECVYVATETYQGQSGYINIDFRSYSRWARYVNIRFAASGAVYYQVLQCDSSDQRFTDNLPQGYLFIYFI